jgi:plastocyanin
MSGRSRTLALVASYAVVGTALVAAAVRGQRPAPPHVHEIRMILDEKGYRFEPSVVTIAPGDSVAFRSVSGQPHSVAFDTTSIPMATAKILSDRMAGKIGTLSGPLLVAAGQRYAIGFAEVPPGHYRFFCLPHVALRMTGEIIVR